MNRQSQRIQLMNSDMWRINDNREVCISVANSIRQILSLGAEGI